MEYNLEIKTTKNRYFFFPQSIFTIVYNILLLRIAEGKLVPFFFLIHCINFIPVTVPKVLGMPTVFQI